MNEEDKLRKALSDIQYLLEDVGEQNFGNFDLELAREQDNVIIEIYQIVEDAFKIKQTEMKTKHKIEKGVTIVNFPVPIEGALTSDMSYNKKAFSNDCMGCPAGEMNGTDCIKDKNRKCWLSRRQ